MGWKPGQGIGPRVKFSQKLNLAEKRGILQFVEFHSDSTENKEP